MTSSTLVIFSLCLIALMLNLLLLAWDIEADDRLDMAGRVAWIAINIICMMALYEKSYGEQQITETPAPAAVYQYETESN